MLDRSPLRLRDLVLSSVLCISAFSPVGYAEPWEMVGKDIPNDVNANDLFGISVAVEGNLSVVGSPLGDGNEVDSGMAYVIDVQTGKEVVQLSARNGQAGDLFGLSVAVSGNLALIGAPGVGSFVGAAYLFDINTGAQLAELKADDGNAVDSFGSSVAIQGGVILIGASSDNDNGGSGSAYVFDASTGKQVSKIVPADGNSFEFFGNSVALRGHIALIGAVLDDNVNGPDAGSVYVYDITTGDQLFKLISDDGSGSDEFGKSVAISGDLAVIGAPRTDTISTTNTGAVYVFDVTTGLQLYKITIPGGQDSDQFGWSVAVDGRDAVVGVLSGDGNEPDSGTAYAFNLLTGEQEFKMSADDGSSFDTFGRTVAIAGNTVIIGSALDDDTGMDAGAVYLYEKRLSNGLKVVPDPLLSREKATFSISQANPLADTWLLDSVSGLGSVFIPQLNVTVDLKNPKLVVGPKMTDENGDVQFVLTIPTVGYPKNVWFQAVQQGNTTNYTASLIEP